MKTRRSVIDNQTDQQGFTLVELLVVIAILAVLLAIILPSLRLATGLARQMVCLSNFRQLGVMTAVYAEEYDQYLLPSARNSEPQLRYPDNQDIELGGPPWYEILRQTQDLDCSRENASVLHCPSDRREKGYCSYSSNRYVMGFFSPRDDVEKQFPLRKITSIRGQLSNLIMFGERGCIEEGDIGKVDGQWSMSGISVSRFLGSDGGRGTYSFGFYAGRHSRPALSPLEGYPGQVASNMKLTFLLLDGHAESYKGQLDCNEADINYENAWQYEAISRSTSPDGYWPTLLPANIEDRK